MLKTSYPGYIDLSKTLTYYRYLWYVIYIRIIYLGTSFI